MRLPRRLSALLVAGALVAFVTGCASDADAPQAEPRPSVPSAVSLPVSYTHLTLPTKRIV